MNNLKRSRNRWRFTRIALIAVTLPGPIFAWQNTGTSIVPENNRIYNYGPFRMLSILSRTCTPLGNVPIRNRKEFTGLKASEISSLLLFSSSSKEPYPSSYDESVDDDDDPSKTRWLPWFVVGGKPRGTNRVIMREAEELGGVPRGDRYSSRDWFHNTITLPNSEILKNIRSPVIAITSWATFLSLLHEKLLQLPSSAALIYHMYIPVAPHSLMMSALGLLLVFRTNSAYQRFAEGRAIWERIINTARDLSRMIMLYNDEIGIDKRRRMQRLLVSFPYLLRHRIRPNLVMVRVGDSSHERDPKHSILLYQDSGTKDNDLDAAMLAKVEEETGKSRRKKRPLYWVDKRTLPWRLVPSEALEKLCRAQNRPLWICDRMAQEIREVPDQVTFSSRERLSLLKYVDKLSGCIGGAERIHQTMVPLNYARHTLRALTLWLFSLPFAIVNDLRLMTGPMLFLVSWLLFGVYEIGYAIEDPFQGTLRLSILCDTVRRDVLGDESIRGSAFHLERAPNGDPIPYRYEEEREDESSRCSNLQADSKAAAIIIPSDRRIVPSASEDESEAYQ